MLDREHDAIHNPVVLALRATPRTDEAPPFGKNNYLLFQIVKEQPNRFILAKKHPGARKLMDEPSLQIIHVFGGSGWIRTIDPRLIKTVL